MPPATIANGLESTVYLLSSGDGDLILKKRRPGGKQQYPFEAFAYEQAKERGALVPTVLFADDDVLLMTALDGQEMDDRAELYTNNALFAQIAGDLAKCHSIQLPGFGEATPSAAGSFAGRSASWLEFLQGFEPDLAGLTPREKLTEADLGKVRAFWQRTLPNLTLKQGALLHGDFALTAIFVDGERYTGLIDFGDAMIGDPLTDLAYFRLKEITKPYGPATYNLLTTAYQKTTGQEWDDATDDTMVLYMIFWTLCRLRHCPDETLRLKFYEKLHRVAELI